MRGPNATEQPGRRLPVDVASAPSWRMAVQVNTRDEAGWSPLMSAASAGS